MKSAELVGLPTAGPDAPSWKATYFAKATLGRFFLAIYRTRTFNADRIPVERGAIIAGNHVSYLDPVLIWSGCPRPIHYLGKAQLFEQPILRWALPRVWTIPVKQGHPDRQAIQTATALLENDELIGIFPEGTRIRGASPDVLGEGLGGVAFIALRANVPIIPVGLAGTEQIMPEGRRIPSFPRVTIWYGEPVCPEDYAEGSRKERVAGMTDEVMRRIALCIEAARKA